MSSWRRLGRFFTIAAALSLLGWAAADWFRLAGSPVEAQSNGAVSDSPVSDSTAPPGLPAYPKIGDRAGVYNNGQAALWDLNIIDHYHYFGPQERARGHKPEQPIKFSHVTHVQNHRIECQYCHWTVNKASFAVIPEVETCMGCHSLITGKEEWQKNEIKKIGEFYRANKPIPWVKVHVMPDYVKFNHKRHVEGGISCQECHGQIPNMTTVERVSSHKMGWCMSCHREQGASIDCWVCHK